MKILAILIEYFYFIGVFGTLSNVKNRAFFESRKPLTVFEKRFILGVEYASEYASLFLFKQFAKLGRFLYGEIWK